MTFVHIRARQDQRPIYINPAHVTAIMRPDGENGQPGDGAAVIMQNGVTFVTDQSVTDVRVAVEDRLD